MSRGFGRRSSSKSGGTKRGTSSGRAPKQKGQIKSGKSIQYSIKSRDGTTKYVGVTNNPRRRAAQHSGDGKLTGGDRLVVQTRPTSRRSAERVEAAKLATHRRQHGTNPRHNSTNDGGFHRPK